MAGLLDGHPGGGGLLGPPQDPNDPLRQQVLGLLGEMFVKPVTDMARGVSSGASNQETQDALFAAMGLLVPGAGKGASLLRKSASALPYQNVPDSLMGFRRGGQNKGFHESQFHHEQPVRVRLEDGQVFDDAIKGLNQSHALERARRNWPGAKIEPLK